MKELSIEEKAKRYDEALKVVEKLHRSWKETQNRAADEIEEAFPELQDGEDERIRKYIMDIVKGHCNGGVEYKKCIAWLEKRKPAKTPEWMIEFLDRYRSRIGASLDYDECKDIDGSILAILEWLKGNPNVRRTFTECTDFGSELEKQVSHIMAGIFNGEFQYNKPFVEYVSKVLLGYAKREIPPEWSEDDEEIRSWLVSDLNTLRKAYAKSDAIYRMETEWLNALKWRVSAQPQAELTDGQLAQAKKDAFNAALDKIEYHSGEPTFDDGWSAAVAFLTGKPFAGKDGWKPTEEQMDALRDAVSGFPITDTDAINSLYNDLRKLL